MTREQRHNTPSTEDRHDCFVSFLKFEQENNIYRNFLDNLGDEVEPREQYERR